MCYLYNISIHTLPSFKNDQFKAILHSTTRVNIKTKNFVVIIRNGKQKQLENICYILHTVVDHDLPADVIKYILRVIELL